MAKQEIFYDIGKKMPLYDLDIDEYGFTELEGGVWYIFGESRVDVWGGAVVYLFDCSEAHVHDNVVVHAFGASSVKSYGSLDEAPVIFCHENSKASVYSAEKVWGFGKSTVYMFGSANVETHGDAKTVDRSKCIRGCDSSLCMC